MEPHSTLPPEAFDDILEELQRQPLPINEYRNKAGAGRSQTFGVVSRRCLPPDYSRMNWLRPKLFHHLQEFAQKHVDLSWNSVTVNQSYAADPHYDRNNKGNSFLVAFGAYTGGELKIHEGPLLGLHTIRHKPIVADFSKILHSVQPFKGDRYSLVYYYFENKRSIPLPPCSVKKEGEKYYFYRGEEKITKKEGLPHPLRNRRKKKTTEECSLKVQPGTVEVAFE
jgi:hypothetical protein